MTWGSRDQSHAAGVAALDLDNAGGAGARGDYLHRHAACGDQASYRAAELGLKAKGKKTGMPRAPWTAEQDKKLRALVLRASSVDIITLDDGVKPGEISE